jgi:hypothetical protein
MITDQFEKIVLKDYNFKYFEKLDSRIMKNIFEKSNYENLNSRLSIFMDEAILEFDCFLYGRETKEIEIDIKYPRDWLEALKERWFPKYILERWPVCYTRVHKKLVEQELYPELHNKQHQADIKYIPHILRYIEEI